MPAPGDHVSVAGKAVNVAGNATVATLSLSGGANGNHVVRTGALAISDDSTLNLNDNDLIIDYSGAVGVRASPIGAWNGASYSGVTGMTRGYTYGEWTGAGDD